MPEKSVLHYDDQCPMCRALVSRLMPHIGDSVDFVPIADPNSKDFMFTDIFGTDYYGQEGITMLFSMYPQVGHAIPYVPDRYKQAVARATYSIGSIARTVLQTITSPTKGCGC